MDLAASSASVRYSSWRPCPRPHSQRTAGKPRTAAPVPPSPYQVWVQVPQHTDAAEQEPRECRRHQPGTSQSGEAMIATSSNLLGEGGARSWPADRGGRSRRRANRSGSRRGRWWWRCTMNTCTEVAKFCGTGREKHKPDQILELRTANERPSGRRTSAGGALTWLPVLKIVAMLSSLLES